MNRDGSGFRVVGTVTHWQIKIRVRDRESRDVHGFSEPAQLVAQECSAR